MNPPSQKPRRAEPLQPDRPGRGGDKMPREQADATAEQERQREAESAKRLKQQSEDALSNTREGYR